MFGQIVSDFFLHHIVGEEVQIPHFIPNHIVFLTPGILTVESQTVMIAFACHLFPFSSHSFGFSGIPVGYIIHTEHTGHFAITGYSHDGFYRKIGIVCPVPGKVIGTKLIFGILSVFYQIIRPDSQ